MGDDQRIGVFYVSSRFLRDSADSAGVQAVFRDVVVLDTKHEMWNDTTKYYAIHPSFDLLGRGVVPPTYRCVITRAEDETLSVAWEKVAEPTNDTFVDGLNHVFNGD